MKIKPSFVPYGLALLLTALMAGCGTAEDTLPEGSALSDFVQVLNLPPQKNNSLGVYFSEGLAGYQAEDGPH